MNAWLTSNEIFSKRWGDVDNGSGDDDDKNENDDNDRDKKIMTTFEEWVAFWGCDEEILKPGRPETFDPLRKCL